MKKAILILAASAFMAVNAQAQSVDEIIDNYFENTGGMEAWGNLKGFKFSAKVSQQGMEIPIEIVQMADGRQYTKISIQGMSIMQGVFDGTTLWSTNFQTMKAEKMDDETTENVKRSAAVAFPDNLYKYKEKGFTAELMGKETVEGTETFKIKLTQKPVLVDGEEVENVTYYYMDTENFVPIVQEKEMLFGPQKGIISWTTLSDYQEVEGMYFPFSMAQGIKDGMSQPITIEAIELNPEVEDSAFTFPEN